VNAKILLTHSTIAPTYPQDKLTSNLDDYGKKASMKEACNKKAELK
jgi:hypothetical protein